MSKKYLLPDSVMSAVRALCISNGLTAHQIEIALRLYSDGFEGNFGEFISVVKKLS